MYKDTSVDLHVMHLGKCRPFVSSFKDERGLQGKEFAVAESQAL